MQDKKSNGWAEKANANFCITGQMALNPRKGEHNNTWIDQPTP